MNVQLYMVDSINYLVDFTHKSSYRASKEPGAGRFDMAVPAEAAGWRLREREREMGAPFREDEVVSPFVFMDVACRLILELAGAGE